MFKLSSLNSQERKAFILHTWFSIIQGVVEGIFIFNEFALLKKFNGTNFQLAILFQAAVIILLPSIFASEILKRVKYKRKFLKKLALFSRLPLLCIAFFPSSIENQNSLYSYLFLIIFFIFFVVRPIVLPIINLLLKHNYREKNFGKLYSYSITLNKIVILVTSFLAGFIFDWDMNAFRYMYPIMGILSILSIYVLANIEYTPQEILQKITLRKSMTETIKKVSSIIKTNKAFRDFEIGFVIYGIGWMISYPYISKFFEQDLKFNYTTLAFYKNLPNVLAIILLPYFGKLLGRLDPRRFAAFTFASLLLYFLFVALTQYFSYHFFIYNLKIYPMLIIGYLFHSVFTATMSLLWHIGSSYFSKADQAANYQSIHLSLVGFRGSFAPLIGISILNSYGFTPMFSLSIFILLIAIFFVLTSEKKIQRKPSN